MTRALSRLFRAVACVFVVTTLLAGALSGVPSLPGRLLLGTLLFELLLLSRTWIRSLRFRATCRSLGFLPYFASGYVGMWRGRAVRMQLTSARLRLDVAGSVHAGFCAGPPGLWAWVVRPLFPHIRVLEGGILLYHTLPLDPADLEAVRRIVGKGKTTGDLIVRTTASGVRLTRDGMGFFGLGRDRLQSLLDELVDLADGLEWETTNGEPTPDAGVRGGVGGLHARPHRSLPARAQCLCPQG